MNNKEVVISKTLIEQGVGFPDQILFFVDCDGYAFGSFENEQEAKDVKTALEIMLISRTPRQIYHGA